MAIYKITNTTDKYQLVEAEKIMTVSINGNYFAIRIMEIGENLNSTYQFQLIKRNFLLQDLDDNN